MNVFIPSRNIISIRDSEFQADFIMSPEEKRELYIERKKKLQEAAAETERQAVEFAFEEWLRELPHEKKRELMPNVVKHLGEEFQNDSLRKHFSEYVWPEKRLEIVG